MASSSSASSSSSSTFQGPVKVLPLVKGECPPIYLTKVEPLIVDPLRREIETWEGEVIFHFTLKDIFNTNILSKPLGDFKFEEGLPPWANTKGNLVQFLVTGYRNDTPFNFVFGSPLVSQFIKFLRDINPNSLNEEAEKYAEKYQNLGAIEISSCIGDTLVDEIIGSIRGPLPKTQDCHIWDAHCGFFPLYTQFAGVTERHIAETVFYPDGIHRPAIIDARSLLAYAIKRRCVRDNIPVIFCSRKTEIPTQFTPELPICLSAPKALVDSEKAAIMKQSTLLNKATWLSLSEIGLNLHYNSFDNVKWTQEPMTSHVRNEQGETLPLSTVCSVVIQIKIEMMFTKGSYAMLPSKVRQWRPPVYNQKDFNFRNLSLNPKAIPYPFTGITKKGFSLAKRATQTVSDESPFPSSSSSSSSPSSALVDDHE